MYEIKETTLAYCAGLLDGDGSFFIGKENGKARQGNEFSPCYTPIIGLSEVRRNSVDFLKSLFGGYIGATKAYVTRDGDKRNEFFRWRVERSDLCLGVLDKVIDYLIIKRDRAIFLRNFILNHIKPVKNSFRTSPQELQARENHYEKMKQYNSDRSMISDFGTRKVVKIIPDEKFWAYVSGLIDSDGAFCLSRILSKGRTTYSYVPLIVITQVDHRGVEYVYGGVLKGNRYLAKTKSSKTGFAYRFELKSLNDISDFIEKCLPYLRLKKERALLLQQFCKIRPNHRFTDEEQSLREKVYIELKSLNMGSLNPL